MKVTINAEFTDEELKKHAEDVGRRWLVDFLQETFKIGRRLKISPGVGEALMNALGSLSSKPQSPPPMKMPSEVTPRPMDRCARAGSMTELLDEGWTCCRCGTYNGLHRPACRDCDHGRCDIVIPPPPAASPRKPPSDPSVQ